MGEEWGINAELKEVLPCAGMALLCHYCYPTAGTNDDNSKPATTADVRQEPEMVKKTAIERACQCHVQWAICLLFIFYTVHRLSTDLPIELRPAEREGLLA